MKKKPTNKKPASPAAGSERVVMNVSEREFATMFAALRYWHSVYVQEGPLEGDDACLQHFEDMASLGGKFKMLTCKEIDTLCENINCN